MMGKVVPITGTATKPAPKSTRFGIYPSYKFTDHDPILDQIDTLRQDAGNVSFTRLSAASGVSDTTLHAWASRKTKRPQFATVAAVVNALGGELTVTYRGRLIK